MRLGPHRLLALALISALILFAPVRSRAAEEPATGKRLALVIGNAGYHLDLLPTAANDAGLVAEALAQDGFAVTAVADADADTLRKAVSNFVDQLRQAGGKSLAFVYISGHGVQYAGANYLVPVDAVIARQTEVPDKAIPLTEILSAIETVPASARIFIFDLAHQNAVAKGEPIPLAAGLQLKQPAQGSIYALNAAPGMIGRPDVPFYGTYARALAEALRTPGLGTQGLLSHVRLRVAEATGGAVMPWSNGEVEPDVQILPAGGKSRPPATPRGMEGLPAETVYWAAIAEDALGGYQAFLRAFPKDPLSGRIRAMKAVRLEAASWAETCRANTAAAYWTFMLRFPRGPHYVDVRRRLAAIHAGLEPPMRFDPTDVGGLPAPSDEELKIVAQGATTFDDSAWPPAPPVPANLLAPPQPAFYAELAPPPLVPTGALPIPAPLPGDEQGRIGLIAQPLMASIGPLIFEARAIEGQGIAVDLSSEDGPISRTTTKIDKGQRAIVQVDAAGEVVSWTTVGSSGGDLTITQTGPRGEVLSKQVTRDTAGDVLTTLTNSAGKLVAETKADKQGRATSTTPGPARITDQSLALAPVMPKPTVTPKAPPAAAPPNATPGELRGPIGPGPVAAPPPAPAPNDPPRLSPSPPATQQDATPPPKDNSPSASSAKSPDADVEKNAETAKGGAASPSPPLEPAAAPASADAPQSVEGAPAPSPAKAADEPSSAQAPAASPLPFARPAQTHIEPKRPRSRPGHLLARRPVAPARKPAAAAREKVPLVFQQSRRAVRR